MKKQQQDTSYPQVALNVVYEAGKVFGSQVFERTNGHGNFKLLEDSAYAEASTRYPSSELRIRFTLGFRAEYQRLVFA